MADGRLLAVFLLVALVTRLQLTEGNCTKPLGMESGNIPDGNIVASTSSFGNDQEMFGAHRARLRSPSGYRADPSAVKKVSFHAITVKLPKAMIVTGIATQGLAGEWVTRYRLMASQNENDYVPFRDVNDTKIEKEFEGNSDGDSINFNTVPYPVQTSQVLLRPTHWHNNIAVRFELYGCEPGHYIRVWLAILNTEFMLSYLDRQDDNTKYMEDVVLYEVNEYLKNVPGFLSVQLHQFSPPFAEKNAGQPDMTADVTVYCIESATKAILTRLHSSLANQGSMPFFGPAILQVQYPVTQKCHPPSVTVSLGKDPWNAKLIIVNEEARSSRFTVSASLQPDCNSTEDVMYSWEVTGVDKESGAFNIIYQYGKMRRHRNLVLVPRILQPAGLQYIRCLARSTKSISAYKYDFGFIETVLMRPLHCFITPSEGRAILDKFTLRCTGGYRGIKATAYTVSLNSSSGPVVIPNWRAPDGIITLPVGNPVEGYSVTLIVEARFTSVPLLVDHAVAKVTSFTTSEVFLAVGIFEDLINAGKYEEATYNMWILQTVVEEMQLSQEQRAKIKNDMMRGIKRLELRSYQQLKHIAAFVVFSNEIKKESTLEIQEISLQFLENAVNFLNEQRAGNISNISSKTETLWKGAALVVGMASEDAKYSSIPKNATKELQKTKNISRRAMESLQNISDMRSRFLRNDPNVNVIRMDAYGAAVLLAKVNSSQGKEQVFRVKKDEIHLPAVMLTGEGSEALKGGSAQFIRVENNPYSWSADLIASDLAVVDLILWSYNGTRLKISNLSDPIRVVFSKERQNITDHEEPDGSLFLKRKEMRYHSLSIPSCESTVTVRIKPIKNITLRIYVRKGSRPTDQQYDLTLTLPKSSTLRLCSNVIKEENKSCSSRDPYEFDLLPNATGHTGRHFIGIEIHEVFQNNTGNSSMVKHSSDQADEDWGTEMDLCVNDKPPPTTPPPTGRTIPRQFNAKTDVNYTFYASVGSCVFWDIVGEKWSARGCQVARQSNKTRVECLTDHLTSFAGHFYVAPNRIDFDEFLNKSLPPENMFVLCAVSLIFAFYAVGLVFARKADNRDTMKVVNSNMNNREQECHDAYGYEVSIQTGMWYGHGTTARVGIQLYGEEGNSDRICFMDPWRERKLFARGSLNKFTFNLPDYLGPLYKVQIWHDNSGMSPSWFLYQVVVNDLTTNEKWHFLADRWLAVERLDGAIEIEVRVTSKSELAGFKSLFQWRAITNFADKHVFLSLFTRPPQNPFTRCQRLTCMLPIILLSLVTNAMFYRLEKAHNPNYFRIGPLELSWRQIVIGVQSGLISFPVNIVTVTIFRNIKRTMTQDDINQRDSSVSKGKSTQGFLPPFLIVIGWLICLTASITSGVITIFYSIQWGAELSNQWLLSVGVSVVQDILIIEPIIIIASTFITTLVNRKPTESKDITFSRKADLVFRGDGEINIQQPSEEKLLRVRNLRLQQRKMNHFFIELVIYISFVVLLMTVCYANRKPSSYHLTKSLKDTFRGFTLVHNPASFWTWFEEELVPGLYDASLYNGSGHSADKNDPKLISSKIGLTVGLPRIRQIRIRPESSCQVFQVEPLLSNHFNQCLADLSDSNKDTTPFYKPGWKPVTNFTDDQNTHQLYQLCPAPWRYTEPTSMNVHLLSYGGDGYVAKLGYDAETALKVKQSLEQNHWIDDKSAVVLVEFVVFEPAELLLSDVMMMVQKFATGMRTKKIDVVLQYIFPSSGSTLRSFYQVCILLWSIIILVLVILEIVKVFNHGCEYFKRFFNWISFLQLLSSSFAMLLVFLKENGLRNFLRQIRNDPFGSWSAFELVKWTNIEEVVLSFTVVITTIKCLKLIQFNRHIHVMKWTLEAAYRYLCSFSVIVLILSLAFAHFGTLMFGSKDEEYATLYSSLSTVLQMAIGIGKLRSKLGGGSSESQMIAPIFLTACMISMTIIFTDTFIAILDEAYHQASSQVHPGEELAVYMKERLKNRIKRSERKSLFRKSFKKLVRKKSSARAEAESLLGCESSCARVEMQTTQMKDAIQRTINVVGSKPSQFLEREIQSKSKDAVVQQTKRAKLAETETESLLSHESLSEQGDAKIQTTHGKTNDRNIEVVGTIEDEFSNANVPFSKFPRTEEDLLLWDVKEAMENARSEFTKYLCKNDHEYGVSCSSLLPRDSRCQPEEDSNQTSKYVSGRPEENQGKITLNVLRRHGHTYFEISQESYV